jgi:hypothetical protein
MEGMKELLMALQSKHSQQQPLPLLQFEQS